MRDRLPVVAAIPNYNMAASLIELLPEVLEQGYDEVYVLDDASTDHSREAVEALYGKDVQFIAGETNLGAGGNRNRVLPVLRHEAILHFIDADMALVGDLAPELIKDVTSPQVAFIGGLVLDKTGRQHVWNFGPRQSITNDLRAPLQARIESLTQTDPERARALRQRFDSFLKDWPNPFEPPTARGVFWALESNLIISSQHFAKVGGYDERLRDHEIQDLAIRLEKLGLTGRFEPLIKAQHLAVQVRQGNRNLQMAKAEWLIQRTHGLRHWFFPGRNS